MFNYENKKSLFYNDNNKFFWNNNDNKKSLFDNQKQNNSLFQQKYNGNYNNNQSLFSNNDNSKSFFNKQYNHQNNNRFYENNNIKQYNNSLGYKFKGYQIGKDTFLSLFVKPEYDHASQEELRLSDYEKFNTGNVTNYKILNTKNNHNSKNNLKNNQSLFNNNDMNQNKSLFESININQGVNPFDNSNNNKEKPLYEPNKGKSLFENNDIEMNSIFDNNKSNQLSLFNDNNKKFTSIFEDNKKENNGGISLFSNINNDKSLFNWNNPNQNNDNNKKFIFGEEIKFNLGKDTLGITDSKTQNKSLFDNEQPKFNFNKSIFDNNKSLFPLGNETKETNKNTDLFKKDNNVFTFSENQTNVFNPQPNFSFRQTNIISGNAFTNNINTDNKTQNQGLNFNISNVQGNNNNEGNFNNKYKNNKNLTLFDIVNPLKNLPNANSIKEEEISKTTDETIQRQKSINQFLEELEQKYENKENIDILDNYGTYLDNSNDYNKYEEELSLYKIPKENDKKYNKDEIENKISKVNSIYEEYEKYKRQYLNKDNNKASKKQNLINNEKENNNSNNSSIKNNQNDFIGRNNDLYQKNIIEIDKLINVQVNINNNLENNKEKEKMIQKNNKEKHIKNNNSPKKNHENIIIEKIESYSTVSNKNDKKNNNNKEKEKEKELAPLELVPKLTKEGYKCIPSLVELSRKTKNELKSVEGFKIYNKYGEVEFKEPVNLLGINLDEEIVIEKNVIDTGKELDYNSIFKLYNFKIEENGLNKYKMNLEKSGGNFLEYKNNEIVWEYKKN